MKKKTVIFTIAAWMALFGCFHVYGYWVERMEINCELSFAFPVQVEMQGIEEDVREYPADSPVETIEEVQRENSHSAEEPNGDEAGGNSGDSPGESNTNSENTGEESNGDTGGDREQE